MESSLGDGDSGGDGEEKPDSGFILKVESMVLHELEYGEYEG